MAPADNSVEEGWGEEGLGLTMNRATGLDGYFLVVGGMAAIPFVSLLEHTTYHDDTARSPLHRL